jgi:hypothetical protein
VCNVVRESLTTLHTSASPHVHLPLLTHIRLSSCASFSPHARPSLLMRICLSSCASASPHVCPPLLTHVHLSSHMSSSPHAMHPPLLTPHVLLSSCASTFPHTRPNHAPNLLCSTSVASPCLQGGSRVSMTGDDDNMGRGPTMKHTTRPQPHKQLLVGWTVGGPTMMTMICHGLA